MGGHATLFFRNAQWKRLIFCHPCRNSSPTSLISNQSCDTCRKTTCPRDMVAATKNGLCLALGNCLVPNARHSEGSSDGPTRPTVVGVEFHSSQIHACLPVTCYLVGVNMCARFPWQSFSKPGDSRKYVKVRTGMVHVRISPTIRETSDRNLE